MIHLDKSDVSIVVTCDLCDWWRAFALDTVEAWEYANRHNLAEHPDDHRASSALVLARRRRADSTRPRDTRPATKRK